MTYGDIELLQRRKLDKSITVSSLLVLVVRVGFVVVEVEVVGGGVTYIVALLVVVVAVVVAAAAAVFVLVVVKVV